MADKEDKKAEEAEQTEQAVVSDTQPPEETIVFAEPVKTESEVLPVHRMTSTDSQHILTSTKRGESNIEKLAEKIENRRNSRIPVTFDIRKHFLKTCRKIAKENGRKNKITEDELNKLRDEYQAKVTAKTNALSETTNMFKKLFGMWDEEVTMLLLLNTASKQMEDIDGHWFYFRDFNFYYTIIAPKMDLFSTPLLSALTWLLVFYFGSAVLFCAIMDDEAACPAGDKPYEGWLTSVYFASVTMSTVGYGDVNLAGEEKWRVWIGTLYMLVALLVGYTVFATAADSALGAVQIDGAGQVTSVLLRPFVENYDPAKVPLYKQVRRIVFLRVFELVCWFFLLNMFGMFVAFWIVRNSEYDWNGITHLYWAVQTTTTIGYGDLDMPIELRWFQIFFTTLGTAFVGSVFGGAASLKNDIADLRRFYAWKRREASKRLIEDMQGPDADNKVDQFEFMVGSLLMLNKIERSDVEQIMDKFRELAGDRGFIMYTDAEEEAENAAKRDDDEDDEIEDQDMQCEIDAPMSRF